MSCSRPAAADPVDDKAEDAAPAPIADEAAPAPAAEEVAPVPAADEAAPAPTDASEKATPTKGEEVEPVNVKRPLEVAEDVSEPAKVAKVAA